MRCLNARLTRQQQAGPWRGWPSFSFNYQKWLIIIPPPAARQQMHPGPDLEITMIWFSKTNTGFAFWSGISISFILYSTFCQVFFLACCYVLCWKLANNAIAIPWLAVCSPVMREMKESQSFQFSRDERIHLVCLITAAADNRDNHVNWSFPPKTRVSQAGVCLMRGCIT